MTTRPENKARRHEGTKAQSARVRSRGFSLTEMLFAIFILGIGVISIAALFPVGLTQQRRSVDAMVGPIVADHALSVLRTKLSADDFGWFLDVNGNIIRDPILPTTYGDTMWRRPAIYLLERRITDAQGNRHVVSPGSIDIFYGAQDAFGRGLSAPRPDTISEVPYNLAKFPDINNAPNPPHIIFTQEERYWPQQSAELHASGDVHGPQPQYVWDCAFRRFQGHVQVAIFVYRVEFAGEDHYHAAFRDPNFTNRPGIPHFRPLTRAGADPPDAPWSMFGELPNDPRDDAIIPGTYPGQNPYSAFNPNLAWQAPGQWLLDQNNNIHRVLSGRRNASDGPVELTRRVSGVPYSAVYSFEGGRGGMNGSGNQNFPVVALWYIPPVLMDADGHQWNLTPVYVTVREM